MHTKRLRNRLGPTTVSGLASYVRFPLGALLASALLWACTPAGEPPTEPPPAIESEAVDIALVGLPESFEVRETGDSLVLTRSDGSGEVQVTAGEVSEFGIDVVQLANDQKAEFTARTDGVFFGAQKLGSQLGEATYARGRYREGDSEVEETRIFAVHPTANRLLTLTYRYPAADDSSERVTELMAILGSIEGRSGDREAG